MKQVPTTLVNGSAVALAPPENPETVALLQQLLEKIDRLEGRMAGFDTLAQQTPGLVSMATDTLDDLVLQARHGGVDLETRLQPGLALLERLTQPQVMNALTTLVDHIGVLENLLQQGPGLLAMAADVGDELYTTAVQSGFDPELAVKNGLTTAKNSLAMVQTASLAQPIGLWGMVRALNDPAIQRAMGVLLSLTRALGQNLAR